MYAIICKFFYFSLQNFISFTSYLLLSYRVAVLNPSDAFYIVNLETKSINFKTFDVTHGCFGDNIVIVALKSDQQIKVLDLNGKPLMNINYGGGLRVANITVYIFIIRLTKSWAKTSKGFILYYTPGD